MAKAHSPRLEQAIERARIEQIYTDEINRGLLRGCQRSVVAVLTTVGQARG